jgi:glycosyltransferase involved in cell wall biosynthesis
MKVLYLIDTLEVGGAESSLLQLLKRARKTEAIVCSIYRGDALKSSFEKEGIRVVSLGFGGKHQYIKAIRRVLSLISKEQPRLIHTILARAHLVGRVAGKLAGLPVVSVFTSEPLTLHRYSHITRMLRIKIKIFEFLDRMTIPFATRFVANSESVKASACKKLGIVPDKISVIYRGRDPSVYSNACDSRAALRREFAVADDVPVILNVGRLVPEKAHKDLIVAVGQAQKQVRTKLLIAGEGRCRPELTKLISELELKDTVELLGFRNDPPALMKLADLFVFPSASEGHPGALIEAMFAGCPIVASDIPVHNEMITHRISGLLIETGNTIALSEAIVWMLKHPHEARQMAQNAHDTAVLRFNIERIVQQHEKINSELLGLNRPPEQLF